MPTGDIRKRQATALAAELGINYTAALKVLAAYPNLGQGGPATPASPRPASRPHVRFPDDVGRLKLTLSRRAKQRHHRKIVAALEEVYEGFEVSSIDFEAREAIMVRAWPHDFGARQVGQDATHALLALGALADDLPERVTLAEHIGWVRDNEPAFGQVVEETSLTGFSNVSLPIGHHLGIMGASGVGKSTAAQTMVQASVLHGYEVHVISADARTRYRSLADRIHVSDTSSHAMSTLEHVAERILGRDEVLRYEKVESVHLLPESVRPIPMLLVVDDYDQLFPGDRRPAAQEGRLQSEALLSRISSKGYRCGVSVVMTGTHSSNIMGVVSSRKHARKLVLGPAEYLLDGVGRIVFESSRVLGENPPKGRGMIGLGAASDMQVQVWMPEVES